MLFLNDRACGPTMAHSFVSISSFDLSLLLEYFISTWNCGTNMDQRGREVLVLLVLNRWKSLHGAGIFPPYQGQDDLHRVWEADELPGGLHLQIWQERIVLTITGQLHCNTKKIQIYSQGNNCWGASSLADQTSEVSPKIRTRWWRVLILTNLIIRTLHVNAEYSRKEWGPSSPSRSNCKF